MTAVDAARLAGSATELARALRAWLPQQRWFAGKARTITGVEVSDLADLAGDLVLVVAEVTFADGGSQRYAVPLVAGGSGDAVAEVVGTALTDAVADTEACRALARLALRPERTPTTSGGVLVGRPLGRDGVTSLEAAIDGAVRPMGVEQSNSSVVFGDALVMKLLRRLEDGDNPEVELTRVLTQAGAPNVPAQRGFVELQGPDTGTAALAVLTDFVAGAREGWAVATAEAAEVARGGSGGELVALMASLGAAVADIHTTLRDALGERQAARQAVERVVSGMHAQLDRVLTTARERAPEATAEVLAAGEQIRDALSRLGVIEIGPFTRVHGDLHLGQVLLDPDGRWQLLDFEGEPARPLADRAEPAPRLRDVAGMLRSFDYVVGHALLTDGGDADRLEAWCDELREAFLTGYLGRAAAGSLPGDETATRVVLDALELDKAVYELGYELANRPDWVAIPVGGIRRLLARTGAPTFQEVHMPTRASDSSSWRTDPRSVASLVAGRLGDPHEVLGAHDLAGGGAVVRAYRPEAESVEVVIDGRTVAATRTSDAGLFEAVLDERPTASGYRLRVRYPDGRSFDLYDPYSFWPTIGEIDLHLVGEGRHEELWRRMGAHVGEVDGVQGTSFAVWAPNASSVRVVAEFNSWDGRLHPMRMLGASGVWELFVPEVGSDTYYRYELVTASGSVQQRADPWAFATDVPPRTSSRVFDSSYEWDDAEWMGSRGERTSVSAPMSVYEVHLGSWRHRDHRSLTYRELADDLVGHVTYMGFTHVELLPAAEHPFGGSWGYQVTGYFAPSARFGDPDDFRYLVDRLHQAGIGVIVDWVPAHFPKDEWALARFDGTALYEHADPRQGEHPDWGTLVFNFGRNEVRNFLIANALYWLEELHVDGLRVDAVASMLYLDYSRQPGEWVPNAYGGRENLEAVSFLQELNRVVYARNPDVAIIAEESTAWPGVTRPVHLGGLGFGFKWNMGWMHDTLDYAAREPIHRRFHHNQMTFSLMYAFTENFVLPFSHDEVVHGKRSLIDKMPGDRWQKFANLRATYGYMWGHPGKQLLFMGSEFGQWREWSEVRELDWYLLDEADHQGLQRMVAALNARYRELPALWRRDAEPEGFTWIDANDADHNTFSFVRYGEDADAPVAVVTNFSPVPRRQRIGLPGIARYWEVFNSDAAEFGGSGSGNLGEVWADDAPWHGMPASAEVTVPPLGTIWLART